MRRRGFLKQVAISAAGLAAYSSLPAIVHADGPNRTTTSLDPNLARDWLARWEQHILSAEPIRYCDHELGEEIGWLISPFLNGFLYGYMATREMKWAGRLADWADAWLKRAVKEPDGFMGWPKSGTGGIIASTYLTDSLLGEAMGLRPLVLMAGEIRKRAALQKQFHASAESWLHVAEQTFEKWNARSCWREVAAGGLWVVPEFGIDAKTGDWTAGHSRRATTGFSNPDNKQNQIARWLLALHDVTGKPVYRDRAEKWFRLMKSRMKTRKNGKYFVWNYWEPAGPWDYNADGSTRHWVGVHPNGGYYALDLEGIVDAFEHAVVFSPGDLQRLIATNRDFMWNQQIADARFQRIDGGQPDARWKDSPGVLWTALAPHDETLRKIFLANHNPESWSGLSLTPWFLARESGEEAVSNHARLNPANSVADQGVVGLEL